MGEALRHHPISTQTQLKGVSKSSIVTSDAYNVNNRNQAADMDGLMAGVNVTNKPGSSIPSIFGRMIFFRTALLNVDVTASHELGGTPVYDYIVSQWLDLLEIVFNKNASLSFEQWNAKQQIKALRASNHVELADAFEKQVAKYFGESLENIYLIYQDNPDIPGNKILLGGTSPYTLVFTSPNWKSDKPVRPLLHRQTAFREFLYKIYLALNSDNNLKQQVYYPDYTTANVAYKSVENPSWKLIKGLVDYIKNSLAHESDQVLKKNIEGLGGKYTLGQLYKDYPVVTSDVDGTARKIPVAIYRVPNDYKNVNGTPLTLKPVEVDLMGRSPSRIQSDFFIDSDTDMPFDAEKTPLILVKGSDYTDMDYYDRLPWSGDTVVPQIENFDEVVRDMPDCDAYRHNWLTTIDFLEDRLVSLPYEMSTANFKGVINVEGRAYLLPIKPKALKYLKADTIINNLQWTYDNMKQTITVSLSVPVRDNSGNKHNKIVLSREYSINDDVDTISKRGPLEEPMSVGISPLLRIDDPAHEAENRYYFFLQYPTKSLFNDVDLKFYQVGSDTELTAMGQAIVPDTRVHLTNSKIYGLHGRKFDAIRLNMSNGVDEVSAMIFPRFESVVVGNEEYYYSIDFGTTNTHIAYARKSTAEVKSFSDNEIKIQAVYLAAVPDAAVARTQGVGIETLMDRVYGRRSEATAQDQAREFYPNFVGNDFSFPIRTVVYQETAIQNKGLYGAISIGFRYPKEPIREQEYYSRIKWDLNSNRVANASDRAERYFEQLLSMIRIHWLKQNNADLDVKPNIALTFPLAMTNRATVRQIWEQAYRKVFGDAAWNQRKISEFAESLAPAQSLISQGQSITSGILNVDIGGGTTDLQYYRKEGGRQLARYNSVLFAADDLWGCGLENVGDVANTRNVQDNLYTRFADELMRGKSKTIKIGFSEIPYDQISLTGKEKINFLLRDEKNQFANAIASENNGNSDARKVAFLHYGAIIYHIVNWIQSDANMRNNFPAMINFTGFGSKYISTIFGVNCNDDLSDFTKKLIKAFGVTNLPDNFSIKFSDNPKAVTAEGAAIFAKAGGANIPQRPTFHYGYDKKEGDPNGLTFSQVTELRPRVVENFKRFITGLTSVQVAGLTLPSFTNGQLTKFLNNSVESYDDMYANLHDEENDPTGTNPINDSLFFWMLKESLYDFDKPNQTKL